MKNAYVDQPLPPYAHSQYAGSRHYFRGPSKDLSDPYIAVLAGSVNFGRSVKYPYNERVETPTDMTGVYLAIPQSGPDASLADESVMAIIRGAVRCVIELGCIQNCANTFYKTYPRQNDRFIALTPEMLALYPDVDFTNIYRTRYLPQTTYQKDSDGFTEVKQTLISTWQEKRAPLLKLIGSVFILLWHLKLMNVELVSGAMFFTQTQINVLNNSSQAVVRIRWIPHDWQKGPAINAIHKLSWIIWMTWVGFHSFFLQKLTTVLNFRSSVLISDQTQIEI